MITSQLGVSDQRTVPATDSAISNAADAFVAQVGSACKIVELCKSKPGAWNLAELILSQPPLLAELERRCALEQGSTAWGWVKDRKWWFLGGGAAVVGGLVWWHSRR